MLRLAVSLLGSLHVIRQHAWRMLALERWDETAHRCLMRVLAYSGQRAAALVQSFFKRHTPTTM